MLNQQDEKYISDTFDQKFAEMKKEMFSEIRSEMFNYMDPFLKEIQAMREEATIQLNYLSRHDKQLENHEDRIMNLEGKLTIIG